MSEPLTKEYLDQMQAHIDEDGTLTHRNAIDLFNEVLRLRVGLIEIRDHTGCSLEKLSALAPSKYSGDYGIGVEDGHRLCSRIASTTLNPKGN